MHPQEPISILIVDDESANLQAFISYLQKSALNLNILNAVNGEMALKIAEIKRPDLVIMDWEMPVMDGIEALKQLKARPETEDVPVIIATGKMTEPKYIEEAFDAGAADFLRKPVEQIELLSRVRSVLNLSRSYRKIKQQNKEIRDSITYASRIQQSLLPPLVDLTRAVSDAFVLYQPRDIVSGDFYWLRTKRKQLVLAVADCTGHGVPGSFMTILGMNHITQIYRDFRDIEINILLDELNERICAILRQTYGNLEEVVVPPMDGMDIALCKIETDTGKVAFASAGRPMYLVKNGQLEVVKGSPRPIGGTSLMYQYNYEKYEADVSPGDCVYLFSDGITDQFSADNSRKFGAKRMKEMILGMYHEPMDKQKQIVEQTLAAWKGNNEQTDDICVVGLRI